jgi:hypothetical protein
MVVNKIIPTKNHIIIIVPGCDLNDNETPTEMLTKRVKDALAWGKFLSQYSFDKNNTKEITLLFTGGSSKNKSIFNFYKTPLSEAEAMLDICKNDKEIKEFNIILEKESKNLDEKVSFTKNIIQNINYDELYLLTVDNKISTLFKNLYSDIKLL